MNDTDKLVAVGNKRAEIKYRLHRVAVCTTARETLGEILADLKTGKDEQASSRGDDEPPAASDLEIAFENVLDFLDFSITLTLDRLGVKIPPSPLEIEKGAPMPSEAGLWAEAEAEAAGATKTETADPPDVIITPAPPSETETEQSPRPGGPVTDD